MMEVIHMRPQLLITAKICMRYIMMDVKRMTEYGCLEKRYAVGYR